MALPGFSSWVCNRNQFGLPVRATKFALKIKKKSIPNNFIHKQVLVYYSTCVIGLWKLTLASLEFLLKMEGSAEFDIESSSLDWKELVGEGVQRDSSSDMTELSSPLPIHIEFLIDSSVSTATCSPGLLHIAIVSL